MARLVVPGYPHHVTQRGSRRQRTFYNSSDFDAYIDLLSQLKKNTDLEIWAWCLMPNHVHFVVVPHDPTSMSRVFGTTHHRYARRINTARRWRGHLWQERFYSTVLDETHLLAAVRYIELNPVRSGLCAKAEDWPWSSVHAHVSRIPDKLVSLAPMCELVPDWSRYLAEADEPGVLEELRRQTRTGRPAGNDAFIDRLEALTGRRIRPRKPGPPRLK